MGKRHRTTCKSRSTRKTREENPILYRAWQNMKNRCLNPNVKSYKDYGGRGIEVYEEWIDFENFLRDMKPTHKPGLTLDRINNDSNYCKENCRWVTYKKQMSNRRNTRLFEHFGQLKTLTDWSKELGINESTLSQRIYVYGWQVEKALTMPVKSKLKVTKVSETAKAGEQQLK